MKTATYKIVLISLMCDLMTNENEKNTYNLFVNPCLLPSYMSRINLQIFYNVATISRESGFYGGEKMIRVGKSFQKSTVGQLIGWYSKSSRNNKGAQCKVKTLMRGKNSTIKKLSCLLL